MALNTWRAGFDLIACDRDQTVLDRFAQEGTRTTTDVSECADADVVIVLLANDAQVMDAILGEDGLVQAIRPGRQPIICMMGTTLPDTLYALKGPIEVAGARLIDAPISGGIVGAEQATLTIMLGGERDDVEAVRPLMEVMGKRIFHCGPLGTAEVVKVINNMLCITNMFLTAEAIELAQKHGVSFEKFAPILSVSTGLNFLTADAELGRAQYHAWAHSTNAYEAIYNVVNKDLHLALKLAELGQLELGLLRGVSQYVDSADPKAMVRWMHSGAVA